MSDQYSIPKRRERERPKNRERDRRGGRRGGRGGFAAGISSSSRGGRGEYAYDNNNWGYGGYTESSSYYEPSYRGDYSKDYQSSNRFAKNSEYNDYNYQEYPDYQDYDRTKERPVVKSNEKSQERTVKERPTDTPQGPIRLLQGPQRRIDIPQGPQGRVERPKEKQQEQLKDTSQVKAREEPQDKQPSIVDEVPQVVPQVIPVETTIEHPQEKPQDRNIQDTTTPKISTDDSKKKEKEVISFKNFKLSEKDKSPYADEIKLQKDIMELGRRIAKENENSENGLTTESNILNSIQNNITNTDRTISNKENLEDLTNTHKIKETNQQSIESTTQTEIATKSAIEALKVDLAKEQRQLVEQDTTQKINGNTDFIKQENVDNGSTERYSDNDDVSDANSDDKSVIKQELQEFNGTVKKEPVDVNREVKNIQAEENDEEEEEKEEEEEDEKGEEENEEEESEQKENEEEENEEKEDNEDNNEPNQIKNLKRRLDKSNDNDEERLEDEPYKRSKKSMPTEDDPDSITYHYPEQNSLQLYRDRETPNFNTKFSNGVDIQLPESLVNKFFGSYIPKEIHYHDQPVINIWNYFKTENYSKSLSHLNIFRFDHTLTATYSPNPQLYTFLTYKNIDRFDRKGAFYNWYSQFLPDLELTDMNPSDTLKPLAEKEEYENMNCYEGLVGGEKKSEESQNNDNETESINDSLEKLNYSWSLTMLMMAKNASLSSTSSNMIIIDRPMLNKNAFREDLKVLLSHGIKFTFILQTTNSTEVRNQFYISLFDEIYNSRFEWCKLVNSINVFDWEKNSFNIEHKLPKNPNLKINFRLIQTPKYKRFLSSSTELHLLFQGLNKYQRTIERMTLTTSGVSLRLDYNSSLSLYKFLEVNDCLPMKEFESDYTYNFTDVYVTFNSLPHKLMRNLFSFKNYKGSVFRFGKIDKLLYAVELVINTENNRWAYDRPIIVVARHDSIKNASAAKNLLKQVEWIYDGKDIHFELLLEFFIISRIKISNH